MASLLLGKMGLCSSPFSAWFPTTSAELLPRVPARVGIPCSSSSFSSSISASSCCSCDVEITRSGFSRVLLVLLGSLPLQGLVASTDPAMAFSLGISGPKDWLKAQKKKTAEYLIAPINKSRERLQNAVSLADFASTRNIKEAHQLVKSAARDCIKLEEGSFLSFQAKTGVEVCTFRLILKNAASLLDDTDPVKLNAEAALDNLISSFTSLDDILVRFPVGSGSNRNAMADAFSQASDALDNFEKGVRDCLGIS